MLFIDVVGSTELGERLDPEALRLVMDRYFAACLSAVTAHGGAVEKFIGDAVLAAFGAIVAREDDAVRAVRAAAQALASLADISAGIAASHQVRLEARCGICSGEVVVVTTPGADFRVIGDAVNTASRLQTAARPGEILIGANTAALVRGQVGLEQIPRLRLKGKANAVPAWRVTDPEGQPAAEGSALTAPLIGRDDELDELRRCFQRVARRRQVALVTVLGVPGIGKSRLIREFLADLPDDATVMAGRCSAYGKGITYAPLADMLRGGVGGWPELASLLSEEPESGRRAAHSLTTIMAQQGEHGAPVGIEEIAWSVRYLLECVGATGPAVVVWEDLHRAEETLLDLVDDVATWLSGVPVLLLCVARTELLEARPAWGGGKPHAMTLELEPLTQEQSAMLVSELVSQGEVQAQEYSELHGAVAAQCDGNPLYAELMLDVFAETAPGSLLPPTIHALLGARLDQLPADERQVLEMAATVGREFSRAALQALASTDQGDLRDLTAQLVRRRLLQRVGPDGFRFTQTVLHDTAYSFTPKARRERWHMVLAQWHADRLLASPDQEDALVFAYHVESACLLRRELFPGEESLPDLASDAADVLTAEGMKALARKDLPAAAALLERGRELLARGDVRHPALALHISDSWIGLWDGGRALAALAMAQTAMAGDRAAEVTCAVQRAIVTLRLGLAPADEVAARMAQFAVDLAAAPGADLGWCRYHQLQAYLQLAGGRAAAASQSLELALARAQALGSGYEEDRLLCASCEVSRWTPSPVSVGLVSCATLADRFAANRELLVPILITRAHLWALCGRLADARDAVRTALDYASALHLDRADAAVLEVAGTIETLAGEPGRAEARYRQAAVALRSARNGSDAPELAAEIARAVFDQGKVAAATALLDELPAEVAGGTGSAAIAIMTLRARIAAATERHDEAFALASEAARLTAASDDPLQAGMVMLDLAIVLAAAGRLEAAASAGASAHERYEAKGATVPAGWVRDWLVALPAVGRPSGRDDRSD